MVQAAVPGGLQVDAPPFGRDGFAACKADASRGQLAGAPVEAAVGAVADEASDDAPAFGFAPGPGMHRRITDVSHAFSVGVSVHIPGDAGRAVSPGSRDLCMTFALSPPDAAKALPGVSVTSSARMVPQNFRPITYRGTSSRMADRQNHPRR
jgi:hypothetical protein